MVTLQNVPAPYRTIYVIGVLKTPGLGVLVGVLRKSGALLPQPLGWGLRLDHCSTTIRLQFDCDVILPVWDTEA